MSYFSTVGFLFADLPSRHLRAKPVRLEELCRDTKFTKREIRVMYRGFKQVRRQTVRVRLREVQTAAGQTPDLGV